MKKLTQEKLKEFLQYDPETGIFSCKKPINSKTNVGDKVGYFDKSSGYESIIIEKKKYKLHRLVFLYMEGYLPENQVDHINRIRNDNRWCNLREVSAQCNVRNGKQKCTNSSGIRGISWCKRNKKWIVQTLISNHKYHVGYFDDYIEAVAHRLAIEQCLKWLDCDISSPSCLFMKEYIENRKTLYWNRGITPTDGELEKHVESPKYIGIDPNGNEFKFITMKEFAKERNLSQQGISRCVQGKQKCYKNWKFYKISE